MANEKNLSLPWGVQLVENSNSLGNMNTSAQISPDFWGSRVVNTRISLLS